ncbi:hypothetical protein ACIQUC_15350 [Curtobacterium sp. NPDC098951]|uniref:hypothetical protein n=1 Tax=Curtobacterium sp. NPDC098951 TaxID=3363974 RepID=UPI00381452A3
MPDELEVTHQGSEAHQQSLEAATLVTTYTPRDLAAELGYANESRPGEPRGSTTKSATPEHTGPLVIDEAHADDVRERA